MTENRKDIITVDIPQAVKNTKTFERVKSGLMEGVRGIKDLSGVWATDQFKDGGRLMLGWTRLVKWMEPQLNPIKTFGEDVRREKMSGTTAGAVYIGQGGSIECIKTYYGIIGADDKAPDTHILDTVDPDVISDLLAALDLSKTRFIVITKSLSTLEIISLYKLFFERCQRAGLLKDDIARRVTLITNEDRTEHEIKNNPKYADVASRGYGNVFYIEAGSGGRFSWDTPVLLAAAAIMRGAGAVDRLRKDAAMMEESCVSQDFNANPAARYAVFKLMMQEEKRNQPTLLLPGEYKPYGPWAGQLDVESLGKNKNASSMMIDHERPAKDLSVYGAKRFFVRLKIGDKDKRLDNIAGKLTSVGFPVLTIIVPGKESLGQLFKMSEFATVFTGYMMGINPVNQPGVEDYKKNQKILVGQKEPEAKNNVIRESGVTLDFSASLGEGKIDSGELDNILKMVGKIDIASTYAAIAYLAAKEKGKDCFVNVVFKRMTGKLLAIQENWRDRVRASLHVAALGEEAPCILHAKQQGFQQGENTEFYSIIRVIDFKKDIPVPDADYTFGKLMRAQGAAMLAALSEAGRMCVRIDIADAGPKSIKEFENITNNSLKILDNLAKSRLKK